MSNFNPIFKLKAIVLLRKGKSPNQLSTTPFLDSVPYWDIKSLESGVPTQFAPSDQVLLTTERDLLIVADGSRSGLMFQGQAGGVGSTLLRITPVASMDTEYLYFFLKSKFELLNKNRIGSSIPHLDRQIFEDLDVPYMDITVQKALVSDLKKKYQDSKHFFETSKNAIKASIGFPTTEDSEDMLKLIQQFRHSALERATSGDLTSDWRAEHQTKRFRYKIDDVKIFLGSGATPRGGTENYLAAGIPFIRSQNVLTNQLDLSGVVYISEEEHLKQSRSHIYPNDVLLNITGASIGRACVAPMDLKAANGNQHVCIIRLNSKKLLPAYLSLFLNAPQGQNLIQNLQTGQTRPALTLGQIRDIVLEVGDIEEQTEILNRLQKYFKTADGLHQGYIQSQQDFESLQKALLQEAFTLPAPNYFSIQDWDTLSVRIATERETFLSLPKKAEKTSKKINIEDTTTFANRIWELFGEKPYTMEQIQQECRKEMLFEEFVLFWKKCLNSFHASNPNRTIQAIYTPELKKIHYINQSKPIQ